MFCFSRALKFALMLVLCLVEFEFFVGLSCPPTSGLPPSLSSLIGFVPFILNSPAAAMQVMVIQASLLTIFADGYARLGLRRPQVEGCNSPVVRYAGSFSFHLSLVTLCPWPKRLAICPSTVFLIARIRLCSRKESGLSLALCWNSFLRSNFFPSVLKPAPNCLLSSRKTPGPSALAPFRFLSISF